MKPMEAQAEIDRLIAGFFAAFDNRNGLKPDLATLLGYFTDKVVIACASGSEMQIHTAMEFALPRIALLEDGSLVDFHETETSSNTDILGPIATRTSRYRKAGLLNGGAYAGTGTKTFQLVALGTGWRILSLAWIDDKA